MIQRLFSSFSTILPRKLMFNSSYRVGIHSTNYFPPFPARFNLFLVPLTISAITASRHLHSCTNSQHFLQNIENTHHQKNCIHTSTATMQSGSSSRGNAPASSSSNPSDWKKLTNAEWARRLSAEEYVCMREGGTEPPFSGQYVNHKAEGVYSCAGCGTELFSSKTKYDSGSGWPAFNAPLKESGIIRRKDNSQGMVRTEILCAKCNAHLGHVFEDGPKPTGERHCVNSVCLKFNPKKVN